MAAKLRATEQYYSEYVKNKVDIEFQKVLVISVKQTTNCDTLDVYFSKEILQEESLPTRKLEDLFQNVSQIFTNVDVKKGMKLSQLILQRCVRPYPD